MPSDETKPVPTRTRLLLLLRRSMRTLASVELLPKLQTLRWVSVVLGLGNSGLVVVGGYLLASALFGCPGGVKLPFAVVALVAGIRIICMVGSGFAQVATAATIVSCATEGSAAAADAVIRHERRMRYKRWLWWTRFGMGVTILQFVGAFYLLYVIVKNFSFDGNSKECFSGWETGSRGVKRIPVVMFLILAWLVAIIPCFTGSDVLRWRSFYATHDTAWKAHYLEVFDHGIREALCCLGRMKYLSVLEEDEVYSVARLLGDLVAYRASGTGHLEFLAGLALLQRHRQSPLSCNELVEAPESRLREAFTYHQFAEAAYTGPLLDFGRNPVLFPCAWLYRQGILTPWSRNRRPVLDGDNWWRGHAAAFLKYVNLPPSVLRRGRVSQTKREAAFFIVVLHHIKSVVIAVRGTETPEDLLTDGLCRECNLTEDDLDGLINAEHLAPEVRRRVLSSFPHYGHSGIVESARELFMQVDGLPEYKESFHSNTTGFLSSLMGVGQECHGYRVCIVGHSLGGSVATLLGIKLYRHFPNLHVYSFGTLPCVDSVVAEACSGFVTSIVYNDEFSARLSVNSIIRLRAAAITALSEDSSADSAMICKIARRILLANNHHLSEENNDGTNPPLETGTMKLESSNHVYRRNFNYAVNGSSEPIQVVHGLEETSLIDNLNTNIRRRGFDELNSRDILEDDIYESNDNNMECFEGSGDLISYGKHVSQFMGNATPSVKISIEDPPEMFLPGLIIHIVPEQRSIFPLWNAWKFLDRKQSYKASIASRESFKDIVVTPYMFLDHLPWRCHNAMQRVLETRKSEGQLADDFLSDGVHAV